MVAGADEKHIAEFDVLNSVHVTLDSKKGRATVEWRGGAIEDTLADAAVAVLAKCESAPQSVRMAQKPCNHAHPHAIKGRGEIDIESRSGRVEQALELMRSQFGESNVSVLRGGYVNGDSHDTVKADGDDTMEMNGEHGDEGRVEGCEIKVDDHTATVAFDSLQVDCGFRPMKDRIQGILRLLVDAIAPFESIASLADGEQGSADHGNGDSHRTAPAIEAAAA